MMGIVCIIERIEGRASIDMLHRAGARLIKTIETWKEVEGLESKVMSNINWRGRLYK